jgi:hypothetical protein
MSSLRYFEFDSTYRNRTLYPSPSEFVIDISQTGQKSRDNALDPVSDCSPILEWNNSFQELASANSITNITISPFVAESMINNMTFQITTTSVGGFRQVNNFYNGCSIYLTVAGIVYSRRIVSYNYLNLTNAIISLDSPMEDDAFTTVPAVATISNPTPLPTNTTPTPPFTKVSTQFFIPTGAPIDNFYVNYYIQVLANPVSGIAAQTAQILSYNGTTRMATLSRPTINPSQDWASNSLANAYFCIRKALPISVGNIYGVSTSGTALQLDVTKLAGSGSSTYNNSALRIVQTSAGGQPITVNGLSNLGIAVNQPFLEEAIISNFVAGSGTFTNVVNAGPLSTFTLTGGNNIFNYIGCLVTNTSVNSPNFSTGVITNAVQNSPGSAYTYTVTAWSGPQPSNGDLWVICTAFINYTMSNPSAGQAFNQNPPIGHGSYPTYEIEQFSRENCNPFTYTGSTVSSQQEVCYEIELMNLVLPNTLLVSGRGGRAIFYPYLYVELQQVASSNSHQRGIMYSNNPNAYRMLFRALVNDTATPATSPFIKIDGDGMTHAVKFKPNDSFKLGVYHANGTLFETVLQDTTPPTQPNPMAQISACFSFKRM